MSSLGWSLFWGIVAAIVVAILIVYFVRKQKFQGLDGRVSILKPAAPLSSLNPWGGVTTIHPAARSMSTRTMAGWMPR